MGKTNGHGEDLSALTTSAAALDAELRRYVELAAAAVRIPLTSEKGLDRAARAIAEAAECERRVLGDVQTLVQAITAAREAQESSSAALSAHVQSVAERRAELDGLLARFAKLGEVAKTLNVTIQKLAAYKASPYGEDPSSEREEMRRAFTEMESGMATVASHAQELATEATGKSFEDLARQAEALRQQILAVKNRLSLLQKSLPGG
jgi:chromosome segregation ATPase